ncbi:Methionyl-tRNA formyltransferase [Roseimaritima multifibrata]|uniref:Methionyl-tRNA formyltransferase n=1 Tax=Roseimaritima multifibrata TaxID=1930274 RepID=A0A517MBF8_9BACT|nr:methionyl-tRNA formyltransferase [Roseimaritima multifibrata]QDS92214.1 Methionyl-tRNA formyltransferase [Roseimaritima multifibrata]
MPDLDNKAKEMRIILMGTGPFAVPSFEAIRQAGMEIPLVVTRPALTKKSRSGPPPAPVREWAEAHQLPLFDPPSINDPAAIETIRSHSPDILFVCDYGQILSDQALAVAPKGGLNLHGSLLPAYRGAAPVQWAMRKGESETGVSIIHMTPRLDGGPVVAQRPLKIQDHETAGELEHRLAEDGVAATLAALKQLAGWDGMEPIGVPQDNSKASRAPRLQKKDGAIDWSQSAAQVDFQIRSMQPWPTAFTFLHRSDKPAVRITVLKAAPSNQTRASNLQAGQIVVDEENSDLFVACGTGLLQIDQLQPAGKKPMAVADFLRGHPLSAEARFSGQ